MLSTLILLVHAWMFWHAFRRLASAIVPEVEWSVHVAGVAACAVAFGLSGFPPVLAPAAWELYRILRLYAVSRTLARNPREAALLRMVGDPDRFVQMITGLLGRAPAGLAGGEGGFMAGSRISLPPPLDFGADHAGFSRLLIEMMSRHPAEAGLVAAIYTANQENAEVVSGMASGYIASVIAPRLMARVLAASFLALLFGVVTLLMLFIADRLKILL